MLIRSRLVNLNGHCGLSLQTWDGHEWDYRSYVEERAAQTGS
jgi:hypothetical protein